MQSENHKDTRKTLLITGGHVTPAIAVIEELWKKGDWEVIYLARKNSQEGSRIPAREIDEISKLGVKIMTLQAGKVPRNVNLRSILSVLRIPFGILAAMKIVQRVKPNVILTFGGFLAVPAAISGKILGIPFVIHEQTVTKGLANAILEPFAAAVAISWEESLKHFKKGAILTGNPIRKAIIDGSQKRVRIDRGNKLPLIYITGGNQGAHAINLVVEKTLLKLLKSYAVVHQCGTTKERSDYKRLIQIKKSLPRSLKGRYIVRDWFNAHEIAWLLANSNLVVSRAGANTISELAFSGAMALLIPLPIAGRDEQAKNARLLKQAGTAETIKQHELSETTFLSYINKMLSDERKYKKNQDKARGLVQYGAAVKLHTVVDEVYEKQGK